MNPKTDATIEILTSLPESETLFETQIGQEVVDGKRLVEVIVKYNGDIEVVATAVDGSVQILNEDFAVMKLPAEEVKTLVDFVQVEYVEAPKAFKYNLISSLRVSCITAVQQPTPYGLKGNGVLLGIIDSGITYAHPDFRNDDGTTRIARLWDQTIEGKPPIGFTLGTEYTAEQINEALNQPTKAEQLEVVPSVDTIGHGTHVAGIAGGNGRGSRGSIIGAAPEAEFIIVKLKSSPISQYVRTIEIMLGVKYVLDTAIALQRPMAINISLGMNEGSHDGQSLIEQYLSNMAQKWKVNIMVGAGNEGNAQNHVESRVAQGEVSTTSFQIPANTKEFQFSLWQNFSDTLGIEIESPTGERTPRILYAQGARRHVVDNVVIYSAYTGPSPLNGDIEFTAFLSGIGGSNLTEGVWQIHVYGIDIVNGRFNIWGPTAEQAGGETFFLNATNQTTLTTPSTASGVITVGAYDSVTEQIAPFSGAGYTRQYQKIKPDLVAPGVDIVSASNTGGYERLSGTSMATPHVTGAVALMMEWGIVQNRNTFLYGESVRTYLLRGTKKDIPGVTVPDQRWGYGKLCLKNTMDIMRTQQILG